MGVSVFAYGIVPADEKYMKMKKIYDLCVENEIDPPSEVEGYFGYGPPNENGMEIDLSGFQIEGRTDWSDYYDIDIQEVLKKHPNIKYIRYGMSC